MECEQWMRIAASEYERLLALQKTFGDTEWSTVIDCDPWTVRDVAAHVTGAAEAGSSFKEQLRQQSKGLLHRDRRGQMAAVNDLQIAKYQALSNAQLIGTLEDAERRGIENRSRIPGPVRNLKLPLPTPLGWASWG